MQTIDENQILAAHKNGLPLLWLALFSSEQLNAGEQDGYVFATLFSDKAESVRRLVATDKLALLFGNQLGMPSLISIFAKHVSNSSGSHILFEMSEIAMMSDVDEFVEELKEFLNWLSGREVVVPVSERKPLNLFARLFGRSSSSNRIASSNLPSIAEFVRKNCNLALSEKLPMINESIPSIDPEAAKVVSNLLGGRWIRPVPWEESHSC